jgi:hypothetical protein
MVSIAQLFLRGSQFLWTLLITALIGNVIAEAFAGNPSSINYAMFAAAFSWVVLLYGLAAAFIEGLAITIVLAVMDVLAVLFTFVAGVVLAAKLGVHSCNNHVSIIADVDSRGLSNKTCRGTLPQTVLPTARTTKKRDVENSRLAQHSSGSCSLATLDPLSWTSSTVDLRCRCDAAVGSAKVGHPCPRSK